MLDRDQESKRFFTDVELDRFSRKAQEKILALQRRCQELRDIVDEYREQPKPSHTRWEHRYGAPHNVPNDSRIVFSALDSQTDADLDTMEVKRIGKRTLEVRCTVGGLRVAPWSTNVVHIKHTQRLVGLAEEDD